MSRIETVVGKLTYANVAATLALVLAMGGTAAYAADELGKNTVGSKQIINGSVAGKDVKKNTLDGDQVDDNGLTGADVDEGSLGTVPRATTAGTADNANALGGVAAASFPRSVAHATGTFTSGHPLSMSVPGYGSINLQCNGGLVYYGENLNPAGIYSGHLMATSSFPYDPAAWTFFNDNTSNNSTTVDGDAHLASEQYLVSTDGSKAVILYAWGWTDGGTCHGSLEALQIR